MDIRVMSTLGMTDDDVEAIEDIEGVESAMPVYSADVLTKKDAEEMVVKLISEPEDMNLISVDEGRMPEASGECLVDNLLIEEHGFKIGDTITVTSGDDTAIGDTVEQDTYTIVGRGRMALLYESYPGFQYNRQWFLWQDLLLYRKIILHWKHIRKLM